MMVKKSNPNSTKSSSGKFRIYCRSLFMTFPHQGAMTHDGFYDKYKEQFGNKIKGMTVAHEMSDEDHPYEHWHLLIVFKSKVNIMGANTLDFRGTHGSYEKTRSLDKAFKYVTKGSDHKSYGHDPCSIVVKGIKAPFRRYVAMCREGLVTREQAYSIFRKDTYIKDYDIIADYYTSPGKYQRFLQDFYKVDLCVEPHVFIKGSFLFRLVQGLEERCKSVYLYGETGLGKTTGIMGLVREQSLFVRHTDQLKKFDPNLHKYIVFDDMCFNHTNYEYMINVVDASHDSQINVKNSMVNVPSSSKKVFTSNKKPEDWSNASDVKSRKQSVVCKRVCDGEVTNITEHRQISETNLSDHDKAQMEAVMRRLYTIEIKPGDVIVADTLPHDVPKGYFAASAETLRETIVDVLRDARDKYFPKE